MTGAAPVALRRVARRGECNVKGAHTDVRALLAGGVIRRTESGNFGIPYNAVQVDFTLRVAA